MQFNVHMLLRISLATLIVTTQFTATASQRQNALSLFNTKSIPLSGKSTYGFIAGSPEMSMHLPHLRYVLSEKNFSPLQPVDEANPDAPPLINSISTSNAVGQPTRDTKSGNINAGQARVLNNQSVIYLHTDMLGSVIAESDVNGNVINRIEYKPFGETNGGN